MGLRSEFIGGYASGPFIVGAYIGQEPLHIPAPVSFTPEQRRLWVTFRRQNANRAPAPLVLPCVGGPYHGAPLAIDQNGSGPRELGPPAAGAPSWQDPKRLVWEPTI